MTPATSRPPPLTEKVPAFSCSDPASAGRPTSADDQPAGGAAAAANGAVSVTDTVEKSAVAIGAVPLVTARPTSTVSAIGMMSVPISRHVAPSEERNAVNVAPCRSIFSHGAATVRALVRTVPPPATRRRWKRTAPDPVESAKTCADCGSSDSLIITPALASASPFSAARRCATMTPSPVSVRWTNVNRSASLPISPAAAVTRKMSLLNTADP